jgi:hypothetical protein
MSAFKSVANVENFEDITDKFDVFGISTVINYTQK